jgi:hypothetical protein
MTLYRGQKSKYDAKPFVPALLRDYAIPKIEDSIKREMGIPDLNSYRSILSGYTVTTCPSYLHRALIDKDHLYYFFLSLVNIDLKTYQNPIFEGQSSGFMKQFVIYDASTKTYKLPDPNVVRILISGMLHIESVFDGSNLRDYSIFQHLNFIFPEMFPIMLLDWTSDFKIAEFFSKDVFGNCGTIVSMEFSNALYNRFCDNIGTTTNLQHQSIFYNVTGYACDKYDCGCESKNVQLWDGQIFNFQVHKPYFHFQQSLITLQQATYLYWPFKYTLQELPKELKKTLGFRTINIGEEYRSVL